MKPRVFIDKDGDVTIVFPKGYDSKSCNVTLVHDRGRGIIGATNVFGSKLSRYVFHCANAYGDSGYCSNADEFTKDELGQEYSLLKKESKKGKN